MSNPETTVIGPKAEAVGSKNVVIGNDSTATGNNNVVIGGGNRVVGNNNTVIGDSLWVEGNNVVIVHVLGFSIENAKLGDDSFHASFRQMVLGHVAQK
jgi:hypothetical protein